MDGRKTDARQRLSHNNTAPTCLKFNAELANFWNLNAKFRFLFVI